MKFGKNSPEQNKERLLALLRERSFRRGKVLLSSGKESDFFVDAKQTVLLGEGHALVGALMLAAIEELERDASGIAQGDLAQADLAQADLAQADLAQADLAQGAEAVAGVALGGCSLASAVATMAHLRGRRLDALYVRKEAKGHGSARRIEGDSSLREGAKVAVVEDVVTTGGSTLRAVRELRERGYEVVGVVALIDRAEGAKEAFEEASVPFSSLYHRRDFLGEGA